MTVQLTFDDDAPITGLADEGQQNKTYPATPALASAEVTPEPVGSGPVVEADYSLPLITAPDVTTVEAGGTVTVNGSGLAAASVGTLALVATDGTVLVEKSVTADANGAIPSTALVVPAEAAEGDYTLRLTGGAVVIDNVTVTVGGATPVDPVVEPDVTEVEAGGTVIATGTGFPAVAEGTVGLYDAEGTAVVEAPVATDAAGEFAPEALVVPDGTAAGDLALRATVGEVTSPDVMVTVTEAPPVPVLTASPETVDSAGDEAARTVTASGTGFPADLAGRVAINTGDGTEVVGADVTVDAAGVLPDTPLIVPEGQAAGDYVVHAAFADVTVDDVALTVTAMPPAEPVITPSKTEVDVAGTDEDRTFTVSGTGFTPEATVIVGVYPGAPGAGGDVIYAEEAVAAVDGSVTGITFLVVPADVTPGDHHITSTVDGTVVTDNTALAITDSAAAVTESATKRIRKKSS